MITGQYLLWSIEVSTGAIREVLDQMAVVGFEMLIYSFGSGFDLESVNTSYIEQVKKESLH